MHYYTRRSDSAFSSRPELPVWMKVRHLPYKSRPGLRKKLHRSFLLPEVDACALSSISRFSASVFPGFRVAGPCQGKSGGAIGSPFGCGARKREHPVVETCSDFCGVSSEMLYFRHGTCPFLLPDNDFCLSLSLSLVSLKKLGGIVRASGARQSELRVLVGE